MFSTQIGRIFVFALIILVIWGCQPKNAPEVIIEFRYNPDSENTALYYVNVVSGADKFHWYDIAPAETMSITLYPGERSESQISVFYQLTEESVKHVWDGPKFKIGQGYRIHILLESNEITARFCNLPCSLLPLLKQD